MVAPYSSISALRLFVYVTVAAVVVTALGNLVTYYYAAPLAGCGIAILISAPIAGRGGMWGGVAAVLAVTLAGLGGPALAEYGRVDRGEVVELADARVDLAATIEQAHHHRIRNGSLKFVHTIAPIVPSTAQPGRPALLYAACHDVGDYDGACIDAWHTPTRRFVPVEPDEVPCYLAMLPPQASSTAGGPVTFVYHVAPEAYLGQLRRRWFGAVWIPSLAWLLIGGLVPAFVQRFRRELDTRRLDEGRYTLSVTVRTADGSSQTRRTQVFIREE